MICEVVIRTEVADGVDVVDVGEMVNELLSARMDIRIVRLTERFDVPDGQNWRAPFRSTRAHGLLKRALAELWLEGYLGDRAVPAGDVFAEAARQGFTTKTIRRAGAELGVIIPPAGGGPECQWRMPKGSK